MMTTPSSSPPDLIGFKRESISFAPPPPELNLARLSFDASSNDDLSLQRDHPQSEHRRSSSADGSGSIRKGRVMSSPPPPSAYTPRVGFDTFDTAEASTVSLTLRSKHRMYKYHHGSRTFLLGLDHKDYSQYALEWAMNELCEDNDELVILRVIDSAEKAQLEAEGKEELKAYQVEAKQLLDNVISQNKEDKALNIVVELVVGRFQDQVTRMIEIYSPDSLIVGTRGRDGAFGGLLPGSMSKYCLQHSPVPVIVVHPFYRRQHRKQKREKDPDRQSYIQLLKLAREQSSDSLQSDVLIPEISVETPAETTPGSSSPDEKDIPRVIVKDVSTEGDDDVPRPVLSHAITDPTPLSSTNTMSANVSPAEKG